MCRLKFNQIECHSENIFVQDSQQLNDDNVIFADDDEKQIDFEELLHDLSEDLDEETFCKYCGHGITSDEELVHCISCSETFHENCWNVNFTDFFICEICLLSEADETITDLCETPSPTPVPSTTISVNEDSDEQKDEEDEEQIAYNRTYQPFPQTETENHNQKLLEETNLEESQSSSADQTLIILNENNEPPVKKRRLF